METDNQPKRTPGKWVSDRHYIMSNKTVIAEVYNDINYAPVPETKLPTEIEFEANAKLIAAAPELLEKLIKARKGIVAAMNFSPELKGWEEGSPLLKMIDETIKKATE